MKTKLSIQVRLRIEVGFSPRHTGRDVSRNGFIPAFIILQALSYTPPFSGDLSYLFRQEDVLIQQQTMRIVQEEAPQSAFPSSGFSLKQERHTHNWSSDL